MHWIQLSLFQWRNLSVGFRQTAYLPSWNTVNCFSSLDDCKCISFSKFDFQRKTNNCFPIPVHCQPTKWEKSFSLHVILTFDSVPKCVRAACENKLILLKSIAFLDCSPPQCIAIQLTTDANQEQIILFNTEASSYLNTHPLGYLMTALPVLICSSIWQKYSQDLLARVPTLSL